MMKQIAVRVDEDKWNECRQLLLELKHSDKSQNVVDLALDALRIKLLSEQRKNIVKELKTELR